MSEVKVNGEVKALWGMSCVVVTYAIYMTQTPDPADGIVLSGIVGAIVSLVTGIVLKARARR